MDEKKIDPAVLDEWVGRQLSRAPQRINVAGVDIIAVGEPEGTLTLRLDTAETDMPIELVVNGITICRTASPYFTQHID